jgi:hypothetical protein
MENKEEINVFVIDGVDNWEHDRVGGHARMWLER